MPIWIRIVKVVLLGAIVGCASGGSHYGSAASSNVITSDDIANSTTTNVWDLLRRSAPHYSYVEDTRGRAVAITTQRGRSSISIANSDVATVIIDGARLTDFVALQMMPTEDVDYIDLLGGGAGTTLQGTNSGAGVIYIHTRLTEKGHD